MKHSRFIRSATLAFTMTLCGALAPWASAHADSWWSKSNAQSAVPASAKAPEDLSDVSPDGSGPVAGNVTELQDLLKAGGLTELRSTRNASYGAQLYFLPREMVYYIALAQETRLWRVVKTQDDVRAESVYVQFSRKSIDLASGEIRRMQLQAQTALLDRVIAVSANRANRLSADLALAQQQDAQVSERQQKLQAESVALASDKAEAERKLRVLQQQVDQLQRQSEAGLAPMAPLPVPIPVPIPAPAPAR
jgi:hypothetical protein